MATRFNVFRDENSAAANIQRGQDNNQQAAAGKSRRAPLGVLSEVNQRPPLAALKPSQAAAKAAAAGPLKTERQPLGDANTFKPGTSKPAATSLAAADKENQVVTGAEVAGAAAAAAAAAVRPKTTTTVGASSISSDVAARAALLDVSMGSPMPLGSPMIVSPQPDSAAESAAVEQKNAAAVVGAGHHQQQQQPSKEELLDDEFFTREYGASHYEYMREMEMRLRARPDYMSRQRDISSTMRAVLVDWLVEVNEEYKMSDETLFMAVSLIDRFLSVMSVVRGKLQLVGTAAMLIASKVEEIYPPQLSEFVYITDDTYTAAQILRMEALLLKTLGFSVGGAHPLTFVRRFAIECGATRRVAHMAQFICELSQLSVPALAFRPSEVAAAAIILAHHHLLDQPAGAVSDENDDHQVPKSKPSGSNDDSNDNFNSGRPSLNNTLWPAELAKFSGLTDVAQLQPVVDHLHELLSGVASSAHRATPDKYSHKQLSSVSLLPLKHNAPNLVQHQPQQQASA